MARPELESLLSSHVQVVSWSEWIPVSISWHPLVGFQSNFFVHLSSPLAWRRPVDGWWVSPKFPKCQMSNSKCDVCFGVSKKGRTSICQKRDVWKLDIILIWCYPCSFERKRCLVEVTIFTNRKEDAMYNMATVDLPPLKPNISPPTLMVGRWTVPFSTAIRSYSGHGLGIQPELWLLKMANTLSLAALIISQSFHPKMFNEYIIHPPQKKSNMASCKIHHEDEHGDFWKLALGFRKKYIPSFSATKNPAFRIQG